MKHSSAHLEQELTGRIDTAELLRQDQEEGTTRAVPVPDPKKPWYLLRDDDVQEGPFTVSELRGHIRSRRVGRETYLWQQGMKEWAPAGELPQLTLLWEELGKGPEEKPSPLVAAPVPAPSTVAYMSPLLNFAPASTPGYRPSIDLRLVPPREPTPISELGTMPAFFVEPTDPSALADFLFADLSGPREPVTDVSHPYIPVAPPLARAPTKSVWEERSVIVAHRAGVDIGEQTSVSWLPLRFRLSPKWLWLAGAVTVLCVALLVLRFK